MVKHNVKAVSLERTSRAGFTLIELLVVIAIISILASIVLSSLSTARDKARIAKARLEVRQIRNAINLLQVDTDKWPGGKTIDEIQQNAQDNEIWDLSTGAAGLVSNDGGFTNWQGPYMSMMPKDSWGNNYFFDTDYHIGTDQVVAIGSFGQNGVGQNVYDSDNIIEVLTWQE